MGRNQSLLDRRAAVVPKGLPLVTQATVATAEGALLVDCEGRELIDFAGGIGAMNVGHCAEPVVAAIQEQAAKLLHTCIHVATYEPYVALCERLAAIRPHGNKTKVLLVNSGAEAVENAVKIARQATGRSAVICYTEAFHGRTLLALSLTSKVGYKAGSGPFAPEVYRQPFPNHYYYGDGLVMEAFVERELRRLRQAFVNVVPPDQVAAILIEPVQGEGGFTPAPFDYLRGLRRLCDEHGIKLICDEVQSGFCRTGKWAAYEHAGITPDLSTFAKSMSGGLPIAAVIGKAELMDATKPGGVGGTFGGNPVACAGALAAIQLMEETNLNGRAVEIGRRLRDRFLSLKKRCPAIGDVRGLGAMIAMELVEDDYPHKPATKLMADLVKACVDRGVLIIPAGSHSNVLRVLSPLVITDEQLERGLEIIETELLRLAPSGGSRRAQAPVRAGLS